MQLLEKLVSGILPIHRRFIPAAAYSAGSGDAFFQTEEMGSLRYARALKKDGTSVAVIGRI